MVSSSSSSQQPKEQILNRITPHQVSLEIKDPVDPDALEQAKGIISELRGGGGGGGGSGGVDGNKKLLEVSKRLGDIAKDATSYVVTKEECKAAYDELPDRDRQALNSIHHRVEAFATVQRNSIQDAETNIPGGKAGHTVSPCHAAGCYAPGGRYPLPSSVIMTAVTAGAAGCSHVILSSPKPAPITKAAAHVCDVDTFLCVGSAQAVAAMAYGVNEDKDRGRRQQQQQQHLRLSCTAVRRDLRSRE